MKRRKKTAVISAAGKRDTRLVMLGRIGYASAVALTLLTLAQIIGNYPQNSAEIPTNWQIIALSCGIILAFAASFFELWYGGRAARQEEKRIRHNLLNRLFAQQRSLHIKAEDSNDSANDGQLIAMLTDNTERVVEFRQVYFGPTLAAILIPFLTLLYVAGAIDWVTGVILLLMIPVIPLGVGGFMKVFAKTSANSRKQRGKLAARYLDAIRNLVLIRLHLAAPRIEAELKAQGEKNRKAIMRLLAGNQIVIIILDGLFSLCLIVVASLMSYLRFQAGAIDLAGAISIIFLSFLLLEPLNQIAGFFYIGMGGMASEKQIRKFLETDEANKAKQADTSAVPGTSTIPGTSAIAGIPAISDSQADSEDDTFDLAIKVRNLHFDYGRGPVLKGINLDVPQGRKIAIVGRSGGGKTTLLKLIKGSLPLQTGSLTVAGEDVRTSETFMQQIAFVAQKTWLFTGNIRDNLRLAKPDATDTEIWESLEKANLAAEVRSMGQQLDSSVGEQGALISGGQAQRLSLARAFLSGRKILILDEPTAQVDIDSEAKLIAAIGKISDEYTVVLVTHRLALLKLADATFTLENGVLDSFEMPLNHLKDLEATENTEKVGK
ncbi:ABC transporter ATP-binding protein/permease [Gleimia sp. 6138-11-ORH1]|uniref:ABC transporter ATP-binding protein/permease n=1 Tax=Gleimia sp. 6138-11-ORH1 TaxID=2973937 RepID=UPI002168BE04|nr:ABC transporter ATP-binding protein [Gleimia sp. 6138-11-ORH1]MCS4484895.1 ABC transporter ATP-binding protein/permease [Gleimia sp. 6138-11-ORH1]